MNNHPCDDKFCRYDDNTLYSSVAVIDAGLGAFLVTDAGCAVGHDWAKALTSITAIVNWLDRLLPTP
jgi:hypothetical protein